MVRVGEVFAGFQVERELGRGGMGAVYLAQHPRLPRRIALKVLGAEMGLDAEGRARFEREGDVVARLDHPNIVTVYDRGVEGEQLWIAMQYVNGIDAAQIPRGALTPQQAVLIAAETARALDYAHAVGIVHRDVKPGNILLARPEPGHTVRVLLTDFGIARLSDDVKHLTRTGTFLATLSYASPEQLSAQPPDGRADQYSLACTLYCLLTGVPPFEADSATAVIAGHLHYPPPSASGRRPDLPRALDSVLARALAKRPEDRFATCVEFTNAAMRALGGISPGPRAQVTSLDYFSKPDSTGSGLSEPAPRERTPNPPKVEGALAFPDTTWDPTHPEGANPTGSAPEQRRTVRRSGAVAGVLVLAAALVVGVIAVKRYTTEVASPYEAMSRAFPSLLPLENGGQGFDGKLCAHRHPDGVDAPRLAGKMDYGRWTAAWRCNGYIVVSYRDATNARAAIDVMKPHEEEYTDRDRNGTAYTNFVLFSGITDQPTVATVFLDDPDRSSFVLFVSDWGIGVVKERWRSLPIGAA